MSEEQINNLVTTDKVKLKVLKGSENSQLLSFEKS